VSVLTLIDRIQHFMKGVKAGIGTVFGVLCDWGTGTATGRDGLWVLILGVIDQ
jgi:hypothetical protein